MLANGSKAKKHCRLPAKTRIRYACKRLESQNSMDTLLKRPREANGSKAKKHYRIPIENANSLCLQTARKPKNTIESLLKTQIRYACKRFESQNSMDTPIDPQRKCEF